MKRERLLKKKEIFYREKNKTYLFHSNEFIEFIVMNFSNKFLSKT